MYTFNDDMVKFGYSEKATKFENFVTFSEYPNFKWAEVKANAMNINYVNLELATP